MNTSGAGRRAGFRGCRLLLGSLLLWITASASGWCAGPDRVMLDVAVGLPKPPYVLEGGGGLEVDIIEQALAAGGYRMRAQLLPPSRARGMMKAGELEAMSSVTEGIGSGGFYSVAYISYRNAAISLSKRHLRITRIADLSGYSVAAFQNASLLLGDKFRAMADANPRYTEHARQILQNRLLYAGRVDVVVGDTLIFAALTRELGTGIDASQAITLHPIFALSPRKMLFRDEQVRDDFNRGLHLIERNGTLAMLYRKYQVTRAVAKK